MEAALTNLEQLETEIEEKLKAIDKDFHLNDKQHHALTDKLYKRRQELVSGKGLPTAEELAGFEAAPSDSSAGHGAAKGVPAFWLNVLCNQDTLAEKISSRDKLALSYCTSIKAVYPAAGGPPTLEMSFSSNPYFSNNLLRRCLGDEEAGVAQVTTDIHWKDVAHKLTVKEVRKGGGGGKKGKKGGKGGKGGAADDGGAGSSSNTRLKPCASFFRFFLPDSSSSSSSGRQQLPDPVALHQDDEEDEEAEAAGAGAVKSAKAERDDSLMRLLLEDVLPHAADLYMAGPLQALSDEDDEEGGYHMVHGAVGSPADLPGPVQALLAALRHNQAQLNALAAQREQQREAAKQAADKLRLELAEKRRALLLPAGSSSPNVPRFWLRVLRSADAACLAISRRDAAVLACLADVRFSLTSSSSSGQQEAGSSGGGSRELHGKLELEFLANPHLAPSCTQLVKDYSFELPPGGEPYLLASRVLSGPAWTQPELDPTHKQGRDGKARPASSFFQLFKQGGGKYAFNLVGDKVQSEANELETELLMELHSHLLLRAGHIYSSLAKEGWPEEDSAAGDKAAWQAGGEGSEEEEEEEPDEQASEDEGEAAHKAAARRAKAKAGGFKITKASVLIAFMVLMLLAEVFVFLDMAGLFKAKK